MYPNSHGFSDEEYRTFWVGPTILYVGFVTVFVPGALIAGHKHWAAAAIAGLLFVPVRQLWLLATQKGPLEMCGRDRRTEPEPETGTEPIKARPWTTEDIRPEPRPTFHRLAWADVHPTMDRLVKEPLRHPDDPDLIAYKCEATGEGFDPKTGEYESGLLTVWYRPVTPKDTVRPRDGRFRH
jgi:hypothetical protein